MSNVRRRDAWKPSAPLVTLVMILMFGGICVWLLRDTSAPVSAMAPVAGPTPAEQTLAAAPAAAAAQDEAVDERSADEVSASEQTAFRSRRALETLGPRELLRQRAVSPAKTVE